MRRSICYCEPNVAQAGDVSTWKFVYTTASNLPKGTKFRFDLESKGRPIDWQVPQTNPKEKENLIWAEISNSKPLTAAALDPFGSFEFVLPSEVKVGESIAILMGSPDKDAKRGTACQKITQRR